MDLISLGTGALGGLLGGNVLGKAVGGGKVNMAQGSLVGIIGGALGTYFLGPTIGPMLGAAMANNLDVMTIIANLLTGAGGGAATGIIWGIIRRMMS
jgi:hypothetical protein